MARLALPLVPEAMSPVAFLFLLPLVLPVRLEPRLVLLLP